MLLNEKTELFLSGQAIPVTHVLDTEDMHELHINDRTNAKQSLVEECIAIQSPRLGAGVFFMGRHSYINNGGYVRPDQGGIFIGRYCSIGRRVTLGAGGHAMHRLSTSPVVQGCKTIKYTEEQLQLVRIARPHAPLMIHSDVWIGDGAVVMSGVTIGVGAIIAANAVVTKDVGPYEIHGGVPAKKIGMRFDESLVPHLLNTAWWECADVHLKQFPTGNIFEFLEKWVPSRKHFDTYCIG